MRPISVRGQQGMVEILVRRDDRIATFFAGTSSALLKCTAQHRLIVWHFQISPVVCVGSMRLSLIWCGAFSVRPFRLLIWMVSFPRYR